VGKAAALQGLGMRRRVAWLAVLALLLNIAFPSLALRSLPPADLFAGALCHAGTTQPQDEPADKAPSQATSCPFCTLLAAPAMPVLPAEAAALPLPGAIGGLIPRGPPALAALPAEIRPPAARAPPILA
jgi:hypothetical protein